MAREYYSRRTGIVESSLPLDLFKELFRTVFDRLSENDYLQEYFGYECVDAGFVPGKLGANIDLEMFRALRKRGLWPVPEKLPTYSEDDLFDVIEFMYDHISKGVEGHFHSYNGCGWHFASFDPSPARSEYRVDINGLLREYGEGYELSQEGEVLRRGQHGLETLLTAKIPETGKKNVDSRLREAITIFRRRHSSLEDRRHAVRLLADVLEASRDKIKSVLTHQDESDLFNIANNFGIRHNNDKQKTKYDASVWLSWMFYFYLATIHLVLRRSKKDHKPTESD